MYSLFVRQIYPKLFLKQFRNTNPNKSLHASEVSCSSELSDTPQLRSASKISCNFILLDTPPIRTCLEMFTYKYTNNRDLYATIF